MVVDCLRVADMESEVLELSKHTEDHFQYRVYFVWTRSVAEYKILSHTGMST